MVDKPLDKLERILEAQELDPVDFADFDLGELKWLPEKTKDGRDVLMHRGEIEIEGKQYEFIASRVDTMKETNYKYHILDNGRRVFLSKITVSRAAATMDAVRDYSERLDVELYEEPVLPRKFSVAFYTKVLEYVPSLKRERPMRHTVEAQPRDGDLDKWNKRYGDLLEQNGYTNQRGQDWVRDY